MITRMIVKLYDVDRQIYMCGAGWSIPGLCRCWFRLAQSGSCSQPWRVKWKLVDICSVLVLLCQFLTLEASRIQNCLFDLRLFFLCTAYSGISPHTGGEAGGSSRGGWGAGRCGIGLWGVAGPVVPGSGVKASRTRFLSPVRLSGPSGR